MKTVTVELTYEDSLRLWVLVFDPHQAGFHAADKRIQKVVRDAIHLAEDEYEQHEKKGQRHLE